MSYLKITSAGKGSTMRWIIFMLTTVFFGACAAPIESPPISKPTPIGPTLPTQPASSAVAQGFHANLPDLGTAPELTNEVWLNTDRPLRLADLRGKVVLLDMWTFDCINCRNVIPSLRDWYTKYRDKGLVVIGNHFPEFDYERDLGNLKDAIQHLNVPYAVAQDNDGATWRAYGTRYWPTWFVIDKRGHVRYTHIGEGAYAETEQAIRDLLKEQ
jgi:thiol-disulfide isomerase/thioredoxin